MRIFSRSRWGYIITTGAAALFALFTQGLVAQAPGSLPGQPTTREVSNHESGAGTLPSDAPAQEAGGGDSDGSDGEFGMRGAARSSPMVYSIANRDDQIQPFSASRVFTYFLQPGSAKPSRIHGQAGYGGEGMGGMDPSGGYGGGGMPGMASGMGGMGGAMGGMGGGMGGMGGAMGGMGGREQAAKSWPTMHALVSDQSDVENEEADQPRRVTIKVVVQEPAFGPEMAHMGGMSGSGDMMMGDASASGVYVELDTRVASIVGQLPPALKAATPQERANIAQLIRLDVWIEDARTVLRAKRNDQKAFAATEAQLKKLLAEEYEGLLAKQRSDAERLRKRLEQLQADVERRAQAKDRVVEVQLGKLVLEAQGLLDSQR